MNLSKSSFRRKRCFPAMQAALGSLCLVLVLEASAQEPNVPFQLGGGWEGYRGNCMGCHGEWGDGTEKGPPLMHKYYLPGHHSDAAFLRAITQGTKAHHWNFGDMLPVDNVSSQEAGHIIAFIRWLQKEKGLLH